jgi:hypothetical protein
VLEFKIFAVNLLNFEALKNFNIKHGEFKSKIKLKKEVKACG